MAGFYPCLHCKQNCENETIQCSKCNGWVHCQCVPMNCSQLKAWSQQHLLFLCRNCCFTNDAFDAEKSLNRLHETIINNPKAVKRQAQTELLLLQTYDVSLPDVTTCASYQVDDVSSDILKIFHPAILQETMPVKTRGDGNCLYRAVSKAITGDEASHVLLRLMTVIELIDNRAFYDGDHRKYVDLICDNRIVCGSFEQILNDAVTINAYSGMSHIYALSAALRKPIRSYYPPQLNAEFVSEPYTRKVVGRGVKTSEPPIVTVMWTQMRFSGQFSPNHFVPLLSKIKHCVAESIVVCEDTSCVSESELMSDVRTDESAENSACASNSISETACETECETACETACETECETGCETVCENENGSESECESECKFVMNKSVHDLANGCIDSSFLGVNDLLDHLQNHTFDQSYKQIPSGVKNNVFFVIQNSQNSNSRSQGHKSSFSDDCGTWNSNSGSTPKTLFVQTGPGEYKNVFLKNGQYCFPKKVKGKREFHPIDPQPENVIELSRYYTTLKKDSNYKKRVSWLGKGGNNVAVVEYLGVFPGLGPHGNSKYKPEYIRTPAPVMQEMSALLQRHKPMDVYNKLTLKHDELSGPSGRQQVYDKKQNDRKKDRRTESGHVIHRKNLADHIGELDRLVTNGESLVKSIIRDQGKAPCLILYTDEQMADIRNLCCSGQTVLGVDKTFNLCDMHVTATCFKQLTVIRETTGESPIFLGPLYIHDNSDFQSYSNFFNHLRTRLTDIDTTNLVVGSDEELALVNAITSAFPNSKHILCKRHLYQNTKQKLIDDCVDKDARQTILDMIFGDNGLIDADDSICFDVKSDEIEDMVKDQSKFANYFKNKLKPNLKEKVQKPMTSGLIDNVWTNNNAESLNHILKQAIDWKSKPLLDLVDTLTTLINTQYKDMRKSLVSTGQFRLADSHKHFGVSKTIWVSKTTDERERLYRRFRNFRPKDKKTVTSTDGQTVIVQPRSLGKKLGQRKRKVNERTQTFKKTKKC